MKFLVKTTADRNLVIEADRVEISTEQGGHVTAYSFWKGASSGTRRVASVPAHNVFAVIEDEAEVADYYDHYKPDWNELADPEIKAPRVERRMLPGGSPSWGVVYDGLFAPFGDGPEGKEGAERNKESVANGGWITYPISETEAIH